MAANNEEDNNGKWDTHMNKLATVKIILIAGSVLGSTGCNTILGSIGSPHSDKPIPAYSEVVMPPNSRLEATTRTGTIVVQSGKGLNRSYTWEGSTRSVGMIPRSERWSGGQGLYYPGPGYHWRKTPDGIRRCVVQEGWQYFITVEEAVQWIKRQDRWLPTVYRDDGLVVGYGKSPQRYQLNVYVWQILIGGKKPTTLPGSNNQAIKTSWDKAPEQ